MTTTDTTESASSTSEVGAPEVISRTRRLWPLVIIIPVLLGFLIWAFTESLSAEQTVDLPRLEVPDLAGLDEAAADERLAELGFVVEEERIPNELVAKGAVVGQRPLPRALIEQGSVVTVVISDGVAGQRVPDVVGETAVDAAAVLQANGLAVELVASNSPRVAEGDVISTTPPAGDRVELSGTVTVVVSTGPLPVGVPDVVGSTVEAGLVEIARLGLGVERIREVYDPEIPERTVIETEPVAGTELRLGSGVELTVIGPPPTRTVPYLVGLTRASATEVASATNINISTVTEELPAGDPRIGRVITQGVPGGAEIRSGVVVEITVGVGPVVTTTTTPDTASDEADE